MWVTIAAWGCAAAAAPAVRVRMTSLHPSPRLVTVMWVVPRQRFAAAPEHATWQLTVEKAARVQARVEMAPWVRDDASGVSRDAAADGREGGARPGAGRDATWRRVEGVSPFPPMERRHRHAAARVQLLSGAVACHPARHHRHHRHASLSITIATWLSRCSRTITQRNCRSSRIVIVCHMATRVPSCCRTTATAETITQHNRQMRH